MSAIRADERPVIFVSYFYPPCNLTGANRLWGWVPHLRKFGIYPIVVTRHWDRGLTSEADLLRTSGKEVEMHYHSWGEEHFIPFKPGLRDRLFVHQPNNYVLFRRLLSIMHLTIGTVFIRFNEMGFMEPYLNKLIDQATSISGVVISGNPFFQFQLGYRLQRNYGIPWIADYRDDWSTNELTDRRGLFNKAVLVFHKWAEKKWLRTATCFTTVSDTYKERLEAFLEIPGKTIENGFIGTPRTDERTNKSGPFTLLYSGTLYPSQDIEQLLPLICEVMESNPELEWKLHFQGLSFSKEQVDRVVGAMPPAFAHRLQISPRKTLDEATQELREADVLLLPVYNGRKGIPSSKIFDYLAARRPVLVYPGDGDVIEKLAGQWPGFEVCHTPQDLKDQLQKWLDNYLLGNTTPVVSCEQAIPYSRESQTERLAAILIKEFPSQKAGK